MQMILKPNLISRYKCPGCNFYLKKPGVNIREYYCATQICPVAYYLSRTKKFYIVENKIQMKCLCKGSFKKCAQIYKTMKAFL